MQHENIGDLLEALPNDYDTDAIEIDYNNNNFDLENAEEQLSCYLKINIVAESVINGQMKQAVSQLKRYDLDATRSDFAEALSDSDINKLINYLAQTEASDSPLF